MQQRPLILLSNDDGIGAPGLAALIAAVEDLGDVIVAAPDRERSAASHSITLNSPLRVDEIAPQRYAIDGTPVDCIYIAALHLAPRKPALCISGINDGFNLGSDVFYSGTVAAAVEATLRGIPSIAVSGERQRPHDFAAGAAFVRELAAETLARGQKQSPFPEGALLNVNIPAGALSGYQVTFLGRRVYRDQVDVRADLRGRSYYWIGGPEEKATDLPGSDCSAVQSGVASVTPLALDLTHGALLRDLQSWDVGTFVRAATTHEKP
ncbi:MAG: 5'/3'-nucleotidase SurE [Deltaproteobacteria bacterium]|nr:5'/3'-nucleotidase SurE [Deltaproteobacteria bacterium]